MGVVQLVGIFAKFQAKTLPRLVTRAYERGGRTTTAETVVTRAVDLGLADLHTTVDAHTTCCN